MGSEMCIRDRDEFVNKSISLDIRIVSFSTNKFSDLYGEIVYEETNELRTIRRIS